VPAGRTRAAGRQGMSLSVDQSPSRSPREALGWTTDSAVHSLL